MSEKPWRLLVSILVSTLLVTENEKAMTAEFRSKPSLEDSELPRIERPLSTHPRSGLTAEQAMAPSTRCYRRTSNAPHVSLMLFTGSLQFCSSSRRS